MRHFLFRSPKLFEEDFIVKKIVSLLLAIAMLFSVRAVVCAADVPQQDYPQRFWDVPKDHWAFSCIAELVNKGVLAGYEDGSFQPDRTVTRAEWAKIMVLAAGLTANDTQVYFTDMESFDKFIEKHWGNSLKQTVSVSAGIDEPTTKRGRRSKTTKI